LHAKFSAINALHEFLAMIRTQFRVTIKEWMSDASREYKSDIFLKVLRENGIRVLQSTPYTPQQNGCTECFNRTIMDKAEAMQHDACLSDKWWEFTVEHTIHLYNCTPVEHLQWCTPFQEMYRAIPDISHLTVFGCSAYVYLSLEMCKDKLTPKSELMIYLGVAEGVKAYCFMHQNGCLFYAAQALFDKEIFLKCKIQKLCNTTCVQKPVNEQPPHDKDVPHAPPLTIP
jgi:hypothetical protein